MTDNTTLTSPTSPGELRWPPLESNPDVFNQFLTSVGVPPTWAFTDVFGLDDELLDMVPQPSIALILLRPSSAKTQYVSQEAKHENVFFLKQVHALDDACGTIAIIHAIANNIQALALQDGPLKTYFQKTKELDSQHKGDQLAANKEIYQLHTHHAVQGQTAVPEAGVSVKHHFICFTEIGGNVYEIDGGKPTPICHGPSTPSLLKRAASIIKEKYMNDPSVVDFSILSLGPAEQ